MRDLVATHRALLAELGVRRLLAAIGGSLGGMQALQWSLDHPGEVGGALVIASSGRLSAQNIAFSAVAREAIMRDPDFAGGDYYAAGPTGRPDRGLALARMIGHITYLSEESMRQKFGRRIQDAVEPRYGFDVDFEVESYLAHQGQSFVERFDANTYLYMTRVMDYFDPFADQAYVGRQVAAGDTSYLVLSFDSDWRFSTEHARVIADELRAAGAPVTFRELSAPTATTRSSSRCRSTTAPSPASSIAWRPPVRADLDVVAALVGRDVRVVDLGCGDGRLLQQLIARQGCQGLGVERDDERFHACVARGVPVTHGDLELELPRLEAGAFDCAVLSLTLQATRRPVEVLRQMRRVAPRRVVSLPNFAHWRIRLDLARSGRMPVSPALPYQWHDTPNIHLCTLRDFEATVAELGMRIARRVLLDAAGRPAPRATRLAANALAVRAVYALES